MTLADPTAAAVGTIDYCYARLGVRPDDLRLLPQITPQLRQIAKTVRRAGQPRIIGQYEQHAPYGPGGDLVIAWPNYLRASDSPDAQKVLAAYDSVPRSISKRLPIEAFCQAAAVSPLRILEVITGVCVRMGAQASTIIAAVNHPRIVEKTVEMALTDDGVEDRRDLHRATGFLPTPKGAQTTIQVVQNAQAIAAAKADATVPSAESTIRTLADRFNASRQLGGSTTPATALPEARPLDAIPIDSTAAELAGLVEDEPSAIDSPEDEEDDG